MSWLCQDLGAISVYHSDLEFFFHRSCISWFDSCDWGWRRRPRRKAWTRPSELQARISAWRQHDNLTPLVKRHQFGIFWQLSTWHRSPFGWLCRPFTQTVDWPIAVLVDRFFWSGADAFTDILKQQADWSEWSVTFAHWKQIITDLHIHRKHS